MIKGNLIKKATLDAAGAAIYIVAIASFLSHMEEIFGPEEPKTVLVPIVMLSLLVLSAAAVGSLILGRPILWYWDGLKKEAISLLVYTLVSFLIITLMFLAALFWSRH